MTTKNDFCVWLGNLCYCPRAISPVNYYVQIRSRRQATEYINGSLYDLFASLVLKRFMLDFNSRSSAYLRARGHALVNRPTFQL